MVRIAQTPDPSQDPKAPLLREALQLQPILLVTLVMKQLTEHPSLEALGITIILDVSLLRPSHPLPETLKSIRS